MFEMFPGCKVYVSGPGNIENALTMMDPLGCVQFGCTTLTFEITGNKGLLTEVEIVPVQPAASVAVMVYTPAVKPVKAPLELVAVPGLIEKITGGLLEFNAEVVIVPFDKLGQVVCVTVGV